MHTEQRRELHVVLSSERSPSMSCRRPILVRAVVIRIVYTLKPEWIGPLFGS